MLDAAAKTPRAAPLTSVTVAAALVVGVIAWLAFQVGSDRQPSVHARTGPAYVGIHQANVRVGGQNYAIPADVEWVDTAGSIHDGGWPACLGGPGRTVTVRFGEIRVTGPLRESWHQVVWVDCRR